MSTEPNAAGPDAHGRPTTPSDEAGAGCRAIGHEPEGRTGLVSGLRGNPIERAAKCVIVADPAPLENETIFFSAARPGRSVEPRTADRVRLAAPRIHPIAQPAVQPVTMKEPV